MEVQDRVSLTHPIHRRYMAEDLVRLRRSDDKRRYIASQRAGRVDPNPHQIEAVIFALSRLPDGGCILADEVGLGKTIEAGLLIAQILAEGARRVLLVTPKPLLGQWQQELYSLFNIDTREGGTAPGALEGKGVFLVGREFAGSERGELSLKNAQRFDLCVVDEAHEVFAGIYKRFDRWGQYVHDSPHAVMAGRFRAFLVGSGTPVLLLTATPIQNSLVELWGLVQYVDSTGTLLGDLGTFRDIFCDGDDRLLAPGQEHELRQRMSSVVQRTLRRQAQDFMERPFVGRYAQLFEYSMSPEEKQLYDDVTSYLLEPGICAFRGNQRRLLLIGFHRRMASSKRALSASLEKVADRLGRMLSDGGVPNNTDDVVVFQEDLEDDELDFTDSDEGAAPNQESVRSELERVESFIARAKALSTDSKARALIQAVDLILRRAEEGKGSGKVVIFTESLTTQDYLRDLLIESTLLNGEEITLFRGTNNSPRAVQALARWEEEVGGKIPAYNKPSRDVAIRLALVHEFATRSRAFISTEAGAKGLNLQFCSTLINYDLPWNPQRIEQRIGRCHRYGQEQDVTVINFLAKDNEAQRLTFEILSQKLDLFGTVLGASDEVLHRPHTDTPEMLVSALGSDFETRLRRIYERARTFDDIEAELRQLRDSLENRRKVFEEAYRRSAHLIQSHLDESVQQVFRRIQEELPKELAEFDRDLEQVLLSYLDSIGIAYRRDPGDGYTDLRIAASGELPDGLQEGVTVTIGYREKPKDADPIHLGHPLIKAALKEAQEATEKLFHIRVRTPEDDEELRRFRGHAGRLVLAKVCYDGFEPTERMLPTLVLRGALEPLALGMAARLLECPIDDLPPLTDSCSVPDEVMEDAFDQLIFATTDDVTRKEEQRFEGALTQLERFVEDRLLLLHRQREAVASKLSSAQLGLAQAVGSEQRTKVERQIHKLGARSEELESKIGLLETRDDEIYQQFREQTHKRRYASPRVERLLEAELSIE